MHRSIAHFDQRVEQELQHALRSSLDLSRHRHARNQRHSLALDFNRRRIEQAGTAQASVELLKRVLPVDAGEPHLYEQCAFGAQMRIGKQIAARQVLLLSGETARFEVEQGDRPACGNVKEHISVVDQLGLEIRCH